MWKVKDFYVYICLPVSLIQLLCCYCLLALPCTRFEVTFIYPTVPYIALHSITASDIFTRCSHSYVIFDLLQSCHYVIFSLCSCCYAHIHPVFPFLWSYSPCVPVAMLIFTLCSCCYVSAANTPQLIPETFRQLTLAKLEEPAILDCQFTGALITEWYFQDERLATSAQ